jgi:plasmid stabilization system protein ParE
MSDYKVRISAAAKRDLLDSYRWGIEHWGEDDAADWLNKIENEVITRHALFPFAFPVAPESVELPVEVRQFKFGRYRVLFTVKKKDILVLRVRGPFTGKSN